MASSNNGPGSFPEKFMELYVPYVTHLLKSNPKNARDAYRTSANYFENKLKEREKIPDKEKEDTNFSQLQRNTPATEETAELKNVSYEADFMYDSVIEIHPAKNNRHRKVAIPPRVLKLRKNDGEEASIQKLTNFSCTMDDLKRNLAEIVSDYEKGKQITGQKRIKNSKDMDVSYTKNYLTAIPDSTSSSDTDDGTEPDVIEEKFEPSQKDGRNQRTSYDKRPLPFKNIAVKPHAHSEIYSPDSDDNITVKPEVRPRRFSSLDENLCIGGLSHDRPTSADDRRTSTETLSLQEAFGVDSLAVYREQARSDKESIITVSETDEEDSEIFCDDSGTRARQNHASRALSSWKARNACKRECGAKPPQAQALDSDEAKRDFVSLPKLSLWKLPFLTNVDKSHNKK